MGMLRLVTYCGLYCGLCGQRARIPDRAAALRESMEELGWTFERERSERIYSRFSIVMPLPKVAYVFRFVVTDPLDGVKVDTWEMRLTHRGDISYLSVDGYTYEELRHVQRLLQELVGRLPRRPWDFPLGQRLEAGLWIPEWSQSRKMWQRMLFDVGERTPKGFIPKGSVGDKMRRELDEEEDPGVGEGTAGSEGLGDED